jgi:hypothetical protein
MSYRIRNWPEYNAGLKQRLSLTFWLDEAVLKQWIIEDLSGKPGATVFYKLIVMKACISKQALRME